MDSRHDQPPPVPNNQPAVWDLVQEDMRERDQVGRASGRLDNVSSFFAKEKQLSTHMPNLTIAKNAIQTEIRLAKEKIAVLEKTLTMLDAASSGKSRSFLPADCVKHPHEWLTDREREIFLLIVSGKATGSIASELALSSKTVSSHKKRLMKKMQVTNVADLVRYAVQHQVVHETMRSLES